MIAYDTYWSRLRENPSFRSIPEVKEVRGSHRVIIGGFSVSEAQPARIALVAVLDNLLKGAATQAVQNLNLAFGLDALTGLIDNVGHTE